MRFKNVCFVIPCLLFVAVTVSCENKNHNFKEISEEEIEYADLPASVQTAFESSEYKDWEIEEVEKVETDKGTLYELELESPDDKHLEIYFDQQGKIIASEN